MASRPYTVAWHGGAPAVRPCTDSMFSPYNKAAFTGRSFAVLDRPGPPVKQQNGDNHVLYPHK